MEDNNMTEYPQIRYHITYDENLTFKDLEDLLKIIRMSNNDVFQEMGISRAEGNDLQIIESIYPGSINLIGVFKVILSTGLNCLAEKFIDRFLNRIQKALESCERNPRIDKPIYCKRNVNIKIDGQEISVESNSPITNIYIEINNKNDTDV